MDTQVWDFLKHLEPDTCKPSVGRLTHCGRSQSSRTQFNIDCVRDSGEQHHYCYSWNHIWIWWRGLMPTLAAKGFQFTSNADAGRYEFTHCQHSSGVACRRLPGMSLEPAHRGGVGTSFSIHKYARLLFMGLPQGCCLQRKAHYSAWAESGNPDWTRPGSDGNLQGGHSQLQMKN